MGVDLAAANGEDVRYDLATIGRLSRKKGIDLLIAAAEALAAEGVRPRIGIAGDGEDREQLEALVRDADIDFPGFVNGAAKARFLESSAAFVFPALAQGSDVEGMPVAMLEALAMGRPTVVSRDTNVQMLPEWDEIAALVEYVEDPRDTQALADAMRRLLALTAEQRAERAQQLQQIIGRYRWDRLIGEYLATIDSALQRARC
jgi:glycosyltransferase involved in cell wall biosynthesis